MKFEIIGSLPTLNLYVNAERTNKYIAAKIKKEATELVAWQVKSIKKIDRPAHFEFTWIVKDKRTDPDNIAGMGQKVLLDGLQLANKLDNDNFASVLSIKHNFQVGDPKVVIRITY